MKVKISPLKKLILMGAVLPLGVVSANEITQQEFTQLKSDILQLKKDKSRRSVAHLSGYGSVGYSDTEDNDGSFSQLQFAPIFHYQIDDRIMLEAELEIEDEDSGETEVKLEYLTIDVVLGNNAILVAGKFLSPIGQFRQNIHPSWINKLPSAPPGFGHGGAAPVSETGAQVRGGFYLSNQQFNYAVYYGNGPQIDVEVETEAGESEEIEIHDVENEGFISDLNGEKSWGGRLGWLPLPKVEIGLSYMGGQADTEFVLLSGGVETEVKESSDITVYGADFVAQVDSFTLRGEYIKQELDHVGAGGLETGSPEWKTFYLQGSYRFSGTGWEAVTRYTDFDSPKDSSDVTQWALGVNYLITENAMVKVAYEVNDGERDSAADKNKALVQLAYGF
mgnify:CR=1 FL=1